MIIEPLSIDGAYVLKPEPIWDHRGFFARCFSREELTEKGLWSDFPEWSLAYNQRQGTLRGMHWQAAPHLEVKLVQCIRGAVFDVIVDMRPDSPTFGQWTAISLSAKNRSILYIPKGIAHGYQTQADHSELLYHISEPFRAESSRGVRWDDPHLAIAWPEHQHRIMSARDATLPLFADVSTL